MVIIWSPPRSWVIIWSQTCKISLLGCHYGVAPHPHPLTTDNRRARHRYQDTILGCKNLATLRCCLGWEITTENTRFLRNTTCLLRGESLSQERKNLRSLTSEDEIWRLSEIFLNKSEFSISDGEQQQEMSGLSLGRSKELFPVWLWLQMTVIVSHLDPVESGQWDTESAG